jgi:ribosomal protein S18 acetylase RimI-like enzyme
MTKWPIESLGRHHIRSLFSCGVTALDTFVRTQISQYEKRRLSRSRVATDDSRTRVIGYYTLAAGAISVEHLPPEVARRLPEHPVPAILLGRLAVDIAYQKAGVGDRLLSDAILRSLQVSKDVGVFAIYVRATDEPATGFYRKYGFLSCNSNPLDLYLPLASYDANLKLSSMPPSVLAGTSNN